MAGVRMIKVSEIPFIPDEQLLVDFLEKYVGKGGCRLLNTSPSNSLHNSEAKLSAFVEIKSTELALDLYKLAKADLLEFWCSPLTVQLLQHRGIPSNPKSVQNDIASTGPKLLHNPIASQSKSVEDIISHPKSMKDHILPELKPIKEGILSGSKHQQCCILTEQKDIISGTSAPQIDIMMPGSKSMQNDIISGTKAPQKDFILSGLKSMQNDSSSGMKAPQKDSIMSGSKSMQNVIISDTKAPPKDFIMPGSKSIHNDISSGIKAPQKGVTMSGPKSMQTLILPEPKATLKGLMAGPKSMQNCILTETKSMKKDGVAGPSSTQNYNNVVEPKPVQKDTVPLPRSRQNDITQGPKSTQMSSFEGLNLHMGCQTSENTFFVSCSRTGVNAEFEFAAKKIRLYLKECSREYKMEFGYGNIRYIHRGIMRDMNTQLLILRMRNAPRIYERCLGSHCNANDRNSKNIKNIQWVRTTDFTEACNVGHSSSLGLELSKGTSISQIQEKFAHYQEIKDTVLLEHGSPFLSTSKLVPILKPPEGLRLPYNVIFKINSLVQNGILSWPTLGKEFFNLLNAERSNVALINQALEKLGNSGWNTCYRPEEWLQNQFKEKSHRHRDAGQTLLENGLMYVNSVQVTPAKIYFSGPEVNVSNRVLRHYTNHTENFLRVSFFDENFSPLHSTDLSRRMGNGVPQQQTKLYERILHVLSEGIVIGDKKFEFLAFSSSQLRESSLWMFASTDTLTADSIRQWMGSFWAIRNVAKCASRMGQSFSSSTETFDIRNDEFEYIDDIEDNDKRYVFSDGIGKISPLFAEQVARKCGLDNIVPSAFQIRFAGYKGMVAVDPTLSDPRSSFKLSLRRSMRKYTSNNRSLDVLSWTKYRPCFLNRQIIILLSTLGVPGHHFEILQKESVELINDVLISRDKALDVLQILYIGENHNVLTDMLSCGYCPRSEPYLSMMLQAFRASKLAELRNKARIFVPKGRCLMGCLDETRTLNYGEVFIQIRDPPGNKQLHGAGQDHTYIMEGKLIVAKNPCLHPGDIRFLSAVKTSKLQHLVDCIVFPQQGKRPHPSECSGSDLDGDVYFVSWDKSLIPPQQDPPMDYIAEPPEVLDHAVTMKEIQEHFVNYMVNDTLGVIANSHMAFADQEPDMARSSKCLQLAELHSTAVDFAKTGVPVQLSQDLFPKKYPDFMEKEDKESYKSSGILGQLYRYVTEADIARPPIAEKIYDEDLEVPGFDGYLEEAVSYKKEYDFRLSKLMDHYGIRNEADIISGNIASLSNSVGGNKRKGDIREAILSAVKSLKIDARRRFETNSGTDQSAKASAWYYVTYHPTYRGQRKNHVPDDNSGHLISFPWVVHDILLRIKRRRNRPSDCSESIAVRENRKSHSSFIM